MFVWLVVNAGISLYNLGFTRHSVCLYVSFIHQITGSWFHQCLQQQL